MEDNRVHPITVVQVTPTPPNQTEQPPNQTELHEQVAGLLRDVNRLKRKVGAEEASTGGLIPKSFIELVDKSGHLKRYTHSLLVSILAAILIVGFAVVVFVVLINQDTVVDTHDCLQSTEYPQISASMYKQYQWVQRTDAELKRLMSHSTATRCTDTPGWSMPQYDSNDKIDPALPPLTCSDLTRYCNNGGYKSFTYHDPVHKDPNRYKNPHQNCCICGKGTYEDLQKTNTCTKESPCKENTKDGEKETYYTGKTSVCMSQEAKLSVVNGHLAGTTNQYSWPRVLEIYGQEGICKDPNLAFTNGQNQKTSAGCMASIVGDANCYPPKAFLDLVAPHTNSDVFCPGLVTGYKVFNFADHKVDPTGDARDHEETGKTEIEKHPKLQDLECPRNFIQWDRSPLQDFRGEVPWKIQWKVEYDICKHVKTTIKPDVWAVLANVLVYVGLVQGIVVGTMVSVASVVGCIGEVDAKHTGYC